MKNCKLRIVYSSATTIRISCGIINIKVKTTKD